MTSHYELLVAEDESSVRDILLQQLEALIPGAKLHTAENGLEAVEQSEHIKELHMAFLDIKMPLMDGLDAARNIRRLHPGCQIIFISAFHDFAFMQEALNIGAINYLLKPFSQPELAASVQKALAEIGRIRKERESTAHIQSQMQKYSHMADSQLLLNIVNGQQSPEDISRHLGQAGVYFQNGLFAILHCSKGASEKRIGGLLRGNDWGSAMKLFLYERKSHVFILAVTSLPQNITDDFSERLTAFCEKVRRLMHCSLSFVIGDEFSQPGIAQKKCFDCYYQLLYDTPYQIFPYHAAHHSELPSDSREYLAQMLAFLDCAQLLGIKQDAVCRNLLLSIPSVLTQSGIQGKNARDFTAQAESTLTACGSMEQLSSACKALCQQLEQMTSHRMGQHSSHDNIRPAIEAYLESHYAENISLESAAQSMQYSPAYFSKLFKRLFGQTFTFYLSSVRMEHAKQLLRTSASSIHDVAAAVGFRDSTYFTSAFRRAVGCTPTEYRANSLKSTDAAKGNGEQP